MLFSATLWSIYNMKNWKIWKWLAKPKNNDIIIEGEPFNPTKELIESYKMIINTLRTEVIRLNTIMEGFQRDNLTLQAKLDAMPRVEIPTVKHFNTFSGLKSELEARSLTEKKKLDAEANISK